MNALFLTTLSALALFLRFKLRETGPALGKFAFPAFNCSLHCLDFLVLLCEHLAQSFCFDASLLLQSLAAPLFKEFH